MKCFCSKLVSSSDFLFLFFAVRSLYQAKATKNKEELAEIHENKSVKNVFYIPYIHATIYEMSVVKCLCDYQVKSWGKDFIFAAL